LSEEDVGIAHGFEETRRNCDRLRAVLFASEIVALESFQTAGVPLPCVKSHGGGKTRGEDFAKKRVGKERVAKGEEFHESGRQRTLTEAQRHGEEKCSCLTFKVAIDGEGDPIFHECVAEVEDVAEFEPG